MSRKAAFLFLFILSSLFICAQNLSVESFKLLENDLTANTQGTMMRDQNGEVAALIRVVTTEKGFVFDGGMMGIVGTKQDVGEILLYVPYGIQKITIKHEQLGVLRDYYFPIPIEKARTYELKLVSGTVHTIVEQAQTSQFVVFKVQPKNAVIFIDEEESPHSLDADGLYSIRLSKGHHSYRVAAASYLPESGVIEVESEKITKQINLKSALATLTVTSSSDAEIWVNDINKGTGKWTGTVEAGIYLVEARKPSHTTEKQEITLSQQEQRTVSLPSPEPLYGSLEVAGTPIESDVFIDGKHVGKIPIFLDKLLIGSHLLEVKKTGYAVRSENVIIKIGETSNINISLKTGGLHEFVDLGLSVKWATCNVGATKPEEYGDYFAWGETSTDYSYTIDTYRYANGSPEKLTKYCTRKQYGNKKFTDNKTILEIADDVAHIKWGEDWRMPTEQEVKELKDNCTWVKTTINDVQGYQVTSNMPGYTDRSIFLPLAGSRYDTKYQLVGSFGEYWSSSLDAVLPYYARTLSLYPEDIHVRSFKRECGYSVRPVCP